MDELKPCPFCGKTPRYLEHKAGFYTERVICDPCGFYIEIDMDDPTAWNRRESGQVSEPVVDHIEDVRGMVPTPIVPGESVSVSQRAVCQRCAELEEENAAWRNGGYTRLWKQRTEDQDKTIERQRQRLLDLREQLTALEAEKETSVQLMEQHCAKIRAQGATIAQQASEIAKLIAAVADHVTVRAEQHQRIKELELLNSNQKSMLEGKHQYVGQDFKFRIDKLTEQLAAAEKDAERYRYLRIQHWSESELCVVRHPKNAVRLGHQCPSETSLDDVIDAAIAASKEGK